MAANDDKRYYWLKLNKNFFKQHEIIIIEAMPNGKDYLIFYLKLLAESVSHEGNLRFSDKIPYSDVMLSALTNTNVDIVRSALKVFEELHMIEILEDGTVHMNETKNMIGSETGQTIRKREAREAKKEQLGYNEGNIGVNFTQEIRDKSIENRYIDKLINDKPHTCACEENQDSNINLNPQSYDERQMLKEALNAKNLDIAEFGLMHKLVRPLYFNLIFDLSECISLSDLLMDMDTKYDKRVVAKAFAYSKDKSIGANNRVGYITSILEKNINTILKNDEPNDGDSPIDKLFKNQ